MQKCNYCDVTCQKADWKTHQIACTNHALIPKANEIVCKLQDSCGVREINQEEFQERTQSIFVIAPVFPKAILNKAKQSLTAIIESPKPVLDAIALFYQGHKEGYGVIALRNIHRGEIIGSFGGQVVTAENWEKEEHSSRSNTYSIAGGNFIFDPSLYASLGAFINDGPPNCECKTDISPTLYPEKSLVPVNKVIVAIREIKKGEIIYYDYAWPHHIKKSPYCVDRDNLIALTSKYYRGLDISVLNKTGWINSCLLLSWF